MSNFKTIAVFIGGVAVGAFISGKYFKKKYSAIADNEIASVRTEYGRMRAAVLENRDKHAEVTNEDDSAPEQPLDPKMAADVLAYAVSLTQSGYAGDIDYSSIGRISPSERMIQDEIESAEDQEEIPDGPKPITPDEYGELLHYKQITLTYYADCVLVDELGELVMNPDDIIGEHALSMFGDDDLGFDDDSVYIRNDRLRCEYEIIRDPRLYSDVLKTKPKKVEV